MNILGFIFSLLLILSYIFYACWEKQSASARLRKTYTGYFAANREISNSYQKAIFKHLFHGKSRPIKPKGKKKAKATTRQSKSPEKPEPNRECAKLNLWPLIQEGRETHPLLYELAVKIIQTFYESFQEKPSHLLDALLAAAKTALQNPAPFALEKIRLPDPDLQQIYYKMLKGTKQWDLSLKVGYPPFLEYVKAEPSKEDKICLLHAHPDMITALFNAKIATRLYAEIHRKRGRPLLTEELVQRICAEQHQIAIDPELLSLLELGNPHHEEVKKTFIADEANKDVFLRKSIYLKG